MKLEFRLLIHRSLNGLKPVIGRFFGYLSSLFHSYFSVIDVAPIKSMNETASAVVVIIDLFANDLFIHLITLYLKLYREICRIFISKKVSGIFSYNFGNVLFVRK